MTANFDGAAGNGDGAAESIETLLGVYALDAVSQEERAEVDALLQRSPDARAELATLQVAVDALAAEAASAPPIGTWDRLRDRLAESDGAPGESTGGAPSVSALFPEGSLSGRPGMIATTGPTDRSSGPNPGAGAAPGGDALEDGHARAVPDELSSRREARGHNVPPGAAVAGGGSVSSLRSKVWPMLAAAAAVVAVLMLGGLVVRQGDRIDNLSAEMASGSIERSAQEALADPSSELVDLAGDDLKVNLRAAVRPDGTGYLFADNLPELPADQTYQLWAARDDNVVSVGVLGNRPRVSAFQTATDARALAITVETAGGVVSSDHDPVAASEFT